MRIVLVAMDAQYIHTNLAVRSIAAYCKQQNGPEVEIIEFTINMRTELILEKLAELKADVYGFSCYIWNVGMVCEVAAELRKICPAALLLAGGPQVSYHSEEFLQNHPCFDVVMTGEGEQTAFELFSHLHKRESYFSSPGIVYKKQGEICRNEPPAPLPMDMLPLAYEKPEEVGGRILYYESMRGCPFGCSYCLSSVERGVRIKNAEKVKQELLFLTRHKPKQIKFVDRTFNCNKQHAMEVWEFLRRNDNGVTNFHFELAGELLDDETLAYLGDIRPGLFQFEIGVQTTNLQTLREINRPAGLEKLFEKVAKLKEKGNIHLHLDLIAGLPYEGMDSFIQSFNNVYSQQPHQFQLGFLKVLAGSGMEQNAKKYGLVWQDVAPFEILFNQWISYEELVELKRIAEMVEQYYNSGRFASIIAYLVNCFATPFEFWQKLARLYKQEGRDQTQLSKTGYYEFLGRFMQAENIPQSQHAKWICRYDLLLHEKPKAVPGWVEVDGTKEKRAEILAFYEKEENRSRYLPEYEEWHPKQVFKMAHLEVFPFNPITGEQKECALLFNYKRRDVTGRAEINQVEL